MHTIFDDLEDDMAENPHIQEGAQRTVQRFPHRTHYAPSYMANVHSRPSTSCGTMTSDTTTTNDASFSRESVVLTSDPALLMIVLARAPAADIISRLEQVLYQRNFATIAVLGIWEQDDAISKLKMDVYGLVGRMRREISVFTQIGRQESEADIATMVDRAVEDGGHLQGVLCCPEYGDVSEIMMNGGAELQDAWRNSVGFVQAVSKACMPHLTTQAEHEILVVNTTPAQQLYRPFFVVTGEPGDAQMTRVMAAAVDALTDMLEKDHRSQGLIVMRASALLIVPPPREPTPVKAHELPPLQTEFDSDNVIDAVEVSPDSPTQLWNMWAQVNEMDSE